MYKTHHAAGVTADDANTHASAQNRAQWATSAATVFMGGVSFEVIGLQI
jgi:hypothetical protein